MNAQQTTELTSKVADLAAKIEIKYIPLNDTRVDHSYQRPLNPSRIKEGGDLYPFKPGAFGVGAISLRDDGTLWLMDAQHRTEAGKEAGHGDVEYPFQVYTGLSVADEALVFRFRNNFKQVTPTDRFRARVIEGDVKATRLFRVLTRNGWKLGGASKPGSFAAIATLESVYDGMRIRREGEQLAVCEMLISMLTSAYGHSTHGMKGEIVGGLGMFLLRHLEHIEPEKLTVQLAQAEGQALGLIGKAKGLKELRGGNVHNAMAEILVTMYNKSRRTRVLPEWTRA